jgi:hypothetical protein
MDQCSPGSLGAHCRGSFEVPTGPPSENASDLADFQSRHGEAPGFAGKGQEIALGRCRMGDTKVVQPDGCGQARRRVEGRNLPPTGGAMTPLKKLRPLRPRLVFSSYRCRSLASNRAAVRRWLPSTYSSSGQPCRAASPPTRSRVGRAASSQALRPQRSPDPERSSAARVPSASCCGVNAQMSPLAFALSRAEPSLCLQGEAASSSRRDARGPHTGSRQGSITGCQPWPKCWHKSAVRASTGD